MGHTPALEMCSLALIPKSSKQLLRYDFQDKFPAQLYISNGNLCLKAPEDVIQEIMTATKPPAIIHAVQKEKKIFYEWQARLLKAFLGSNRDGFDSINGKKKKKKTKAYNVLEADPDFENCNGWSVTVGKHDLSLLEDSNFGVFMVNLTKVCFLNTASFFQ